MVPRPVDATATPRLRFNLTVFLSGQVLSNIGTFGQVVAQSLLVLDLTGSSLALGLVLAVQFVPALLLGPWAGVQLDRIRLRPLLIATALLGGIQAGALAVLVSTGHATLGGIVALSLLLGLIQVFDRPGSLAFLRELAGPEGVARVVSLNSSTLAAGRLGGPALSGVLYAWQGAAACFTVNAISYGAVVLTLALLRTSALAARPLQARERGQLADGLRFAWESPLHRVTLLTTFLVGCFAFNFPLFYSTLVRFSFHAGAGAFGAAESINALFGVAAGVVIARRPTSPTLAQLGLACTLLGLSLTYSAVSLNVPMFLLGMPYFGVVAVLYTTSSQSILQHNTPPAMIGRVMSLYTMGIFGTTPIGGLLCGWVASATSPRWAIALGAASLFVSAAAIAVVDRAAPLAASDERLPASGQAGSGRPAPTSGDPPG